MPGHLIQAACTCGFTKELSPGFNPNEGVAGGYGMAYTESEADLDTFKGSEIARRQLNELADPFLQGIVAEFSLEKLDALLKRQSEPQGPHHCPRCQRKSLLLHFRGHWD
jgi:hypothetical protein